MEGSHPEAASVPYDEVAGKEALLPPAMEDSHICHDIANVASLPYDGFAVHQAVPPYENSHTCHHIAGEAAEPTHSWRLTDQPDHSRLPAKADESELDAIFAGQANIPSATVLDEQYGEPSTCYDSSLPRWLADSEHATSILDHNASPDTHVMNRLFGQRAVSRQVQHDSWANCMKSPSSNVPGLHELFGTRDCQVPSLKATLDADDHAIWADEPNTQLNRTKSDLW